MTTTWTAIVTAIRIPGERTLTFDDTGIGYPPVGTRLHLTPIDPPTPTDTINQALKHSVYLTDHDTREVADLVAHALREAGHLNDDRAPVERTDQPDPTIETSRQKK